MERGEFSFDNTAGTDSGAIDPANIFDPNGADGGSNGGSGGDGGNGNSGSGAGGDAPFGYTASGRIRKRPVGSGKRQTSRPKSSLSVAPNVEALTGVLFNVHLALAHVAKTPELMIDPKEAKMLADASAALMSEYGTEIDPRAFAWGNFIAATGAVYGPRVLAIMARKQQERTKQHAASPATATA